MITDYRPVFNEFYKGGTNIKKLLILRPKLGVLTLFLGESIHDFHIFCTARWVRANAPPHPSPCVKAGLPIYVKFVKIFYLANETWCALTVLSLNFEKGDAF